MTTEVIVEPAPAPPPAPPRTARIALRLLQAGAIVTALVATLFRAFDLDRFFVPKELALHAATAIAALFLIARLRTAIRSRVDVLLAGYFALSALSALLATNHWAALRALAITASAIALFWIGRELREAGLTAKLMNGLSLAVVIAAITSLVQTYGLDLEVFATSRVPGGTLGNRNFIAHAAAFGFPLLLFGVFRVQRAGRVLFYAAATTLTIATLVLTRSRAAWLAFAVVLGVALLGILFSCLRRSGRVWARLAIVIVAMAAGVAAALLLPNSLRWNSDNPYLETAQRVADFKEGSGHGRLVQYERSGIMSLYHQLLGVGPGNWPVVYPKHAKKNDPSLDDSAPGMTSNPWPSSDWVASVSERGVAATALLALALGSLFLRGIRDLFTAPDTEMAIRSLTLLGMLAGAVVTGLFDAVLLLAFPTMIVWPALGALSPDLNPEVPRRWAAPLAVLAVVAVTAIGAARSGLQLAAMQIYATTSSRASLERAAQLDPGNFRLQMRLARMGKKAERCEHAIAAVGLFPQSHAAKNAANGCE